MEKKKTRRGRISDKMGDRLKQILLKLSHFVVFASAGGSMGGHSMMDQASSTKDLLTRGHPTRPPCIKALLIKLPTTRVPRIRWAPTKAHRIRARLPPGSSPANGATSGRAASGAPYARAAASGPTPPKSRTPGPASPGHRFPPQLWLLSGRAPRPPSRGETQTHARPDGTWAHTACYGPATSQQGPTPGQNYMPGPGPGSGPIHGGQSQQQGPQNQAYNPNNYSMLQRVSNLVM